MVTNVTEVTMPVAPPGSSATNYSKVPVDVPHGKCIIYRLIYTIVVKISFNYLIVT